MQSTGNHVRVRDLPVRLWTFNVETLLALPLRENRPLQSVLRCESHETHLGAERGVSRMRGCHAKASADGEERVAFAVPAANTWLFRESNGYLEASGAATVPSQEISEQ